jgi:uncharacterized protein (DUF1501 family)
MKHEISRRNFLQSTAGLGGLLALGGLNSTKAFGATTPNDYKALVCVFLFGGNDAHNTVVPLAANEYTAYQNLRGGLALPPSQILPINAGNASFGLHYGLPNVQNLYNQGKAAIVANVGSLVKPTQRNNLQIVPSQLFSHSDQVIQMQTGAPDTSFGTGWGGRVADLMKPLNAGTSFPTSISITGNSLFCNGDVVQSASIVPGNDLSQYAASIYPPQAGDARALAQKEIANSSSNEDLVNAANKVMTDAINLSPLLKQAVGNPGFSVKFPPTYLGQQLYGVARIMGLRQVLGVSRQVFFVSMGGFDTHSGQDWQHWNILQQLDQSLSAFYTATQEMLIPDAVTTFTASEFGRTLQSNGVGSDHGWGGHHFVLGGAVRGGDIYGTFPAMNLAAQHFYDSRGILIPQVSLSQYAATIAKWFGVTDPVVLQNLFPTLANFTVKDLGFMW